MSNSYYDQHQHQQHHDSSYPQYSDSDQGPYNDPFLNPPRTPGDTGTELSWPRGRDSGIPAYDALTYKRNEHGETEAQAVASNYRSHTPLSPDSDRTHVQRSGSGDDETAVSHNRPTSLADNLTYIDEDFNYYKSKPHGSNTLDSAEAGLVANAQVPDETPRSFQNMEYANEPNQTPKSKLLGRFMGGDSGRYPLEQRIENKRRGVPRQNRPFAVYVLTAIMSLSLSTNWSLMQRRRDPRFHSSLLSILCLDRHKQHLSLLVLVFQHA
jgi:hypothetical protein